MSLSRTLREAGRELVVLDRAVYATVQATPSPTVDHAMARISGAADHAKLWLAVAGGMSVLGDRPRRAAGVGLVALGAASALVNVALKPSVGRG